MYKNIQAAEVLGETPNDVRSYIKEYEIKNL